MSEKMSDTLLDVEQLHEEGNHEDALEILESISETLELSTVDHAKYLLLEGKIRKSLEQYQQANNAIDNLLQLVEDEKDPLLKLDALDLKAEILWRTSKISEGLVIIDKAQDIFSNLEQESSPEIQDKVRNKKARIYSNAGILYWYRGDLDISREYHEKSLRINQDIGDQRGMSVSLNNLGLVCISKGDIEQAIAYYQQGLKIVGELEDINQVAKLQDNLGIAYTHMGELDQALEYFQLCLSTRKDLGSKYGMANSFINIGAVYELKGNLQEALEYYQQCLKLAEEVGKPYFIAISTNNIGSILIKRGELADALPYFQRSLKVSEEVEIKGNIALALINLGDLYMKGGLYDQAKESYIKGQAIYAEMENDIYVSITHFELLCIALEIEDHISAQSHLDQIHQINRELDNKVIDQRYRIGKALIHKSSSRAVDKMKAQEILEIIVREEVLYHELTVLAMFHLCELLLFEYKMTEEDEVINKIRNITRQLEEIAEGQSSHSLLVKVNLLRSKLAMLDLDVSQAKVYLLEAKIVTREKGLHNLERKVIHEEHLLTSQQARWQEIVEKNITGEELIGVLGLDDLLQRMVKRSVAVLTEDELIKTQDYETKGKYLLRHQNFIDHAISAERSKSRLGIAQIGCSHEGNFVQEYYSEIDPGLFILREDKISNVTDTVERMVNEAVSKKIDLLIFPELTIDLGHSDLLTCLLELASTNHIWIIPGSYHDLGSKQNYCKIISPGGVLWEQQKQIPAIIHYQGKRIVEGISISKQPGEVTVAETEFGRIAVVICRDFLDMDLRVALKNHEPPVDILINIAFTPVTEDFRAAHFDARRSIYAYCFFANVAEFGNSLIFSPEKTRSENKIPAGKEDLIFQDIDLFGLRAERKNWEREQRQFIQSTR